MSVLCVGMHEEWVYRKGAMLGVKWRKKEEEGIRRAVGTSEQKHFILRDPHHKPFFTHGPAQASEVLWGKNDGGFRQMLKCLVRSLK